MKKKLFFLLIINLLNTHCCIEKYFKKATCKGPIHCMKNIDFIYMLNLDQRPEKWNRSCQELAPYNIIPYRFSAINGWIDLTLQIINDLGLKFNSEMEKGIKGTSYKLDDNFLPSHGIIENIGQTYFSRGMHIGTIAIVLSHLSILQDAYDSGYETIWMMQDDIQVLSDPRELSNKIEKLDSLVGKGNWDILFTDQDTRDNNGNYVPAEGMAIRPNFNPKNKNQYFIKRDVNEEFRQIGARFGAYSMILRKSGIEKILNFIKEKKIFLPFDLDFYLPTNIKMYTVKKDIVTTLINAPTDNKYPFYQEKLENYFKNIKNKGNDHKIENLDFIYVINNEKSNRWNETSKFLAKFNINPYSFKSINIEDLTFEDLNFLGVKVQRPLNLEVFGTIFNKNLKPNLKLIKDDGQTYFCSGMSIESITNTLNHLSILQDAYDSGYNTIWIMEDNVIISSNPNKLSSLINELDIVVGKNNWDVLYTDKNAKDRLGNYIKAEGMAFRPNFNPSDKSQYYVKDEINDNFLKVGARFGSYSIIIRRSGMDKILNFFKNKKIYNPYDLDLYLAPGLNIFCVKEDITTNGY